MTAQSQTGRPPEDWLQEVLTMLYFRKLLMLRIAGAILAGAVLIILVWPRTYRVSGSILVHGTRVHESVGLMEEGLRPFQVSKEDLASELKILQSRELARRTILALRHAADPEDGPDPGAGRSDERTPPGNASPALSPAENAAVNWLDEELEAIILPATRVIEVRLSGSNPDRIETVLKSFLQEYRSYRSLLSNPDIQESFYAQRMQVYEERLAALEQAELDVVRGAVSVRPEVEIEANYELRAALTERLSELEEEQIQSSLMQDTALAARIEHLKERISDLDARNLELHEQLVALERIRRDSAMNRANYETLARRQEEVRVRRAVASANLSADVTLLTEGGLQPTLLFPRPLRVLAAAGVAAVFAALSIAFVAEYFDHTYKLPRQVETRTGLPVLASIRRSPRWVKAKP